MIAFLLGTDVLRKLDDQIEWDLHAEIHNARRNVSGVGPRYDDLVKARKEIRAELAKRELVVFNQKVIKQIQRTR